MKGLDPNPRWPGPYPAGYRVVLVTAHLMVIPYGGLAAVLGSLLALSAGQRATAGAAAVAAPTLPALYFQRHPKLNIIALTVCVFTMTCWPHWLPDDFTESVSL